MARSSAVAQHRASAVAVRIATVVAASLFVAVCARLSFPLPFTPVPLTLANFAVLAVGLALGSRAGCAALALYLIEGLAGMPVFSPAGPGGLAQLLGPTGGYLISYPAAAFAAGFVAEHLPRKFVFSLLAAAAGNLVVFAGGISWLMVAAHASLLQAAAFGVYPFVFAEVAKITAAAGLARTQLVHRLTSSAR